MENNIKEKVEDRLIDLIGSGSGGRLIIFKPEKSDKDLAIGKKGDYKRQPIFIKVYDKADFDQGKNSVTEDNSYSVFVHFDIVKQDIEDEIWIEDAKLKILINKKELGKFLFDKIGK
jgi:hypothetical protein